MALKTQRSEEVTLAPFGIEIDTPRNGDVLLQCIPGMRLRGAVDASKPVIDHKTGDEMIPASQVTNLGMLPKLPGMQLHVNPARLSYQIIDPLHDNEELCNRIAKAMEQFGPYRAGKGFNGVAPQKGKIDVHQMKSLVREVVWLLDSDCAKMVKGNAPTLEDAEALPGNFLLNPGSRIPNGQPRFEKDYDAWVARVNELD